MRGIITEGGRRGAASGSDYRSVIVEDVVDSTVVVTVVDKRLLK